MSGKIAEPDAFLAKFLPKSAEAEEEEGLPSLKDDEYRPHARPSNKPCHSLHLIMPDGTVRSFQYVHLDSNNQYAAGKITLRFMGMVPTAVVIEGRNLWTLYDYLHQHRVAWVMQAARDFAEAGKTVATKIIFSAIKEEN